MYIYIYIYIIMQSVMLNYNKIYSPVTDQKIAAASIFYISNSKAILHAI